MQPLSNRTFGRFHARRNFHEEETGVDFLHNTVTSLSKEMVRLMEIDPQHETDGQHDGGIQH